MRTVRIFVSSPGDAVNERRRVERVVERLSGAYASDVRLSAVRWETSFYAAHSTFQAQIPEAAACDLVVAIFRNRLGTALPPDFPRMADGEPYPSGTAYEVLTAIEARKGGALPDVFVFRYPRPPSVTLDDPEREAEVREQWVRLKQFFERWFVSQDGQFKAAFQTYEDVDAFEQQVETLLRRWLEEHVLGAGALAWSIAAKGSPFRGLEAFGAKHAEVFFGRDRDIESAVDALKDAAADTARLPFLLLIGPSGSGKSSLARAGLVPRLTAPGVVAEVDVWRTAVMRPGETGDDPFLALANRLFDAAADLPEGERGRPEALPELRDSDHGTPQALADLLRHADDSAVSPILRAMDRIEALEKASADIGRAARARLLLVVDQFDELLDTVDPEQRRLFARLLGKLAGTRRVWIVATLRADLYQAYSAEPELLTLKTAGAAYDVSPPGAAALEEIVRRPAEAAGLVYDERVLADGRRQRLDERLIADAGRPDMLPLVQFTLNRLFEQRRTEDGRTILAHAAYDELGGLDGAVAQEAERALAPLGDAERSRLPRLLRQVARGGEAAEEGDAAPLAIHTVAYAKAAHDPPAKALVDALIAARILLVDGGGGDMAAGQVRLAHQRVLEAWPRAKEIVAANARFFRIKPEVERAERRWQDNGQPTSLLLPRGVALSEAEAIAGEFGEEIAPGTLAYIRASGRRARRSLHVAVAAAAVFAVVAVGAGVAGYSAYRAEQRAEASRATAERNFDLAKRTVDDSILQFVQGFKNADGIRSTVLQRVLDSTRQALDRLAEASPQDTALQRSRAVLLSEFGDLMVKAGDTPRALASFEASLAISRALAGREPENPQWQNDVSMALNLVGDRRAALGDRAGALAAYEESQAIRRGQIGRDPGNAQLQSGLAASLARIGGIRESLGDRTAALAAHEEVLALRRALVGREPNDSEAQRNLSIALSRVGDVRATLGDRAAAVAAYEESLVLKRALAKSDPDSARAQRDVSLGLDRIGDMRAILGERAAALAAYEESLALRRGLGSRDPDNAVWQRDVSLSLDKIGDMRMALGERAGALAAYEEGLAIRRSLARIDPDNTAAQRDVALSLDRIGDMRATLGERASALAAYEEGLAIRRLFVQRDPDNTAWQRDMAIGLNRIGDMRAMLGERAAARAAYEESLAIRRGLSKRDPDNTVWQRDLSVTLNKVGESRAAMRDSTAALRAYEESLAIRRGLARRDPDNTEWQRDVTIGMERVADVRAAMGEQAAALAALQESLALRRGLARRDPNNIRWQRDLSISLEKIGQVQTMIGENAAALAAFEESLAITRALLKRDPDSALSKADLVRTLYETAIVTPDAGARRTLLTEAQDLLQRPETRRQLTRDEQNIGKLIERELAKTPSP